MFLTRSLIAALCCLAAGLFWPGHASAQQAAGANAPSARFASVWKMRGDVTAVAVDGQQRPLRVGDGVFVGEQLRAEPSSEAVLKTEDAGVVAVRPGASFLIERFSAEGKPSDEMTLRVISGAVRMITGWIGRVHRVRHVIVTPTSSIGIRGTDHEPYVVTADLAAALGQPEGTYDKVNRGGTTLQAYGRSVDITPGKVGFARSANAPRIRALGTLLLPVLLDKIPDFYVPGQFDAELDQLSQTSDVEATRQYEERARSLPKDPPTSGGANEAAAQPRLPPAASPARPAVPASPGAASRDNALTVACRAQEVARTWLGQLDTAIIRRDAVAIIAMYTRDVKLTAITRDRDGNTTSVDISRQEFVDSTITAMQGLSDFRQRRLSIEGQVDVGGSCDRVSVKSLVLEQGVQGGRPYRFESVEEFVLERRAGRWLASRATTLLR